LIFACTLFFSALYVATVATAFVASDAPLEAENSGLSLERGEVEITRRICFDFCLHSIFSRPLRC